MLCYVEAGRVGHVRDLTARTPARGCGGGVLCVRLLSRPLCVWGCRHGLFSEWNNPFCFSLLTCLVHGNSLNPPSTTSASKVCGGVWCGGVLRMTHCWALISPQCVLPGQSVLAPPLPSSLWRRTWCMSCRRISIMGKQASWMILHRAPLAACQGISGVCCTWMSDVLHCWHLCTHTRFVSQLLLELVRLKTCSHW